MTNCWRLLIRRIQRLYSIQTGHRHMADRLLQVLPSVVREIDKRLEVEADFCEGLRLYLDTFDEVTVACPVTTAVKDSGLRRCRPVGDLPWGNRVRFIPLP